MHQGYIDQEDKQTMKKRIIAKIKTAVALIKDAIGIAKEIYQAIKDLVEFIKRNRKERPKQ